MRDITDYTESYNIPSFELYQVKYRRKKILEVIQSICPKNILEIGCGMEPLFEYIDMENIINYAVVEPSAVFYDHANSLSNGNPKINCINNFLENCLDELSGYHFDLIICSSLLHELENPVEFLKEVSTLCDKNTIFHINVPNAKSLHRLVAKEMGIIKNEYEMSERNKLLQQHTNYDMDTLKEVVGSLGFSILDSGSYFVKPFTHEQMFRAMENDILSEEVLEGLYGLAKYIPEYGSEIYVNCSVK